MAGRGVVLASVLAATLAGAEQQPARFFIAGAGRLAVTNAHTGERADVTYRRADGTYDDAAFAALRRVLRSRGDGSEGPLTSRFVEMLSHLYELTGRRPIRLLSGYRSPDYNEAIRKRGGKAASASLHTEGMAADLAFPKADLEELWHRIRALECCGAGYYAASGFLHVDVGRPRFWEAHTSGVGKNLSAENARLFALTDFDRYATDDVIVVSLHSMTLPPVRVRATVAIETAQGVARITAPAADAHGCIEADARTRLRIEDAPPVTRGTLLLRPCEPRPGATPEVVRTNPITVAPPPATPAPRPPGFVPHHRPRD